MATYREHLQEELKDPELKAKYDALEAEYNIQLAMMKAEIESGVTSRQLSEKTGVPQSEIVKIENDGAELTLGTLQRLAAGLGMRLRLEFQPA